MERREENRLAFRQSFGLFTAFPFLVLAIFFLINAGLDMKIASDQSKKPVILYGKISKNEKENALRHIKKYQEISGISKYTQGSLKLNYRDVEMDIRVNGLEGEFIKNDIINGNVYSDMSLKGVVTTELIRDMIWGKEDAKKNKSKAVDYEKWVGKKIQLSNGDSDMTNVVVISGIVEDEKEKLYVSNDMLKQLKQKNNFVQSSNFSNELPDDSGKTEKYAFRVTSARKAATAIKELEKENVQVLSASRKVVKEKKILYTDIRNELVKAGILIAATIVIMVLLNQRIEEQEKVRQVADKKILKRMRVKRIGIFVAMGIIIDIVLEIGIRLF